MHLLVQYLSCFSKVLSKANAWMPAAAATAAVCAAALLTAPWSEVTPRTAAESSDKHLDSKSQHVVHCATCLRLPWSAQTGQTQYD